MTNPWVFFASLLVIMLGCVIIIWNFTGSSFFTIGGGVAIGLFLRKYVR